jgi:DNA-binding NarL/FixJ family response regulator
VLVADDHDQMRCSIVELLCERYQVVGTVSDGEELVRSANCLLPDVIVSDIFMPRIDGLTARKQLIAQQLAIPFVFVSALGKEVVQFIPNDSPVAFVYKIEMIAHLLAAVAGVLVGQRYLSPYYSD